MIISGMSWKSMEPIILISDTTWINGTKTFTFSNTKNKILVNLGFLSSSGDIKSVSMQYVSVGESFTISGDLNSYATFTFTSLTSATTEVYKGLYANNLGEFTQAIAL